MMRKKITCLFFSVHGGYRELQDSRDRHPDEIRNLHIGNPMCIGIDSNHCPDDCSSDKDDIHGCQHIVFELKLYGRENDIKK